MEVDALSSNMRGCESESNELLRRLSLKCVDIMCMLQHSFDNHVLLRHFCCHDMGSEEEVDFIGQLDDLDVDQVMATGVTAANPNGVDAVHLSKIWRISTEDTKRMLAVTSQHGQCAQDPMLSQNYGTNDCMLQYQHIHEHLFMDTFFATSKGGKTTHVANFL